MLEKLDFLEGKNILITGATGDIGSKVAELLCQSKCNIYAFKRKKSSLEKLFAIKNILKFIDGDVVDIISLNRAFERCKPDIVFHLAAQAVVSKGFEYPIDEFSVNVGGTVNILELARKHDSKVVFASSVLVYGEPKRIPIREDDPTNPISTNGASKLCAEKYCEIYNSIYGLNVIALRYFNVYGPSVNKRIMFDFYKKLKQDPTKLEILGTGKQIKDYIYIYDVAEATILSSKLSDYNVFNVSTGKGTTVIEVARMIADKMGVKPKMMIKGGISWKGDVQRLVGDPTKIHKVLKWKAEVPLKEGISRTIDWYEKMKLV